MSLQDARKRSADAWRWAARHSAQIAIALITIYALYALRDTTKHELIPATLFTGFAALCSVQALTYTREKFRLDLYEKRLEYYTDVVEYCSRVLSLNMTNEEYRNKLEEVAYRTIRGNGIHKARLLFGEDIHAFATELHDGYMVFRKATHPRRFETPEDEKEALAEEMRHFTFATRAPDTTHKRFGKYIYFGNYKAD